LGTGVWHVESGLTMIDSSRLLVVGMLAVALWASALFALFALWRQHRRGPGESPPRPGRRAGLLTVVAAAVLLVVAAVYAAAVEPAWLDVTVVRLTSPKLPPGARPLRLVQISDLHVQADPGLETEVVATVRALAPDLIAFTGDALGDAAGLVVFRETMTALGSIAPTVAVRGNWDVWYWSHLDLFGGTGVRVLDGDAVSFPHGDARVWLLGAAVEDPLTERSAALARAVAGTPATELRIALHHYPERIHEARELGVDLMLAGDTHGGQLRLPGLGALARITRFGAYHEPGVHHVGDTTLFISRGVGGEGPGLLAARFLCRPEVVLIEVHGPAEEPR
jgi:hypothetical protein